MGAVGSVLRLYLPNQYMAPFPDSPALVGLAFRSAAAADRKAK